MGILIAVAFALLAAVLLLGFAVKLVVQLGVLAFAILAAAAIGSLWLSAAIGFTAFFGIVELTGRQHIGWAVAGALVMGAVVWVGFMRGIGREILSASARWRRFVARAK